MTQKKEGIPFDGFGQVVEMLQYADVAFREKILRGIAQRDPRLAQRLLAATRASQAASADEAANSSARLEASRAELARAQHIQRAKTYGN